VFWHRPTGCRVICIGELDVREALPRSQPPEAVQDEASDEQAQVAKVLLSNRTRWDTSVATLRIILQRLRTL
jgi:hypothetical protein